MDERSYASQRGGDETTVPEHARDEKDDADADADAGMSETKAADIGDSRDYTFPYSEDGATSTCTREELRRPTLRWVQWTPKTRTTCECAGRGAPAGGRG